MGAVASIGVLHAAFFWPCQVKAYNASSKH